jgi:hypothetical protein
MNHQNETLPVTSTFIRRNRQIGFSRLLAPFAGGALVLQPRGRVLKVSGTPPLSWAIVFGTRNSCGTTKGEWINE